MPADFKMDNNTMKELDKREDKLAGILADSRVKHQERDAGIFKEMGDIYHDRGKQTKMPSDFIKASGLYNVALVRTKNTSLNNELQKSIKLNEIGICKVLNICFDKLPSEQTSKTKLRLSKIRQMSAQRAKEIMHVVKIKYDLEVVDDERIEDEKSLVVQTRCLFGDISKEMKGFVQFLIRISKNILGPHPQEYAILGLGSFSRGEMTPYSDFEWAILIEDDKTDKQYFRNLVYLVHLFVLNLGETWIKSLGIRSLNDFDKDGGNWYVDKVTPVAFTFDSCAPWACKTPLGRPDRPNKQGIELIQTPETMASFCGESFALKEGYHSARILSTVCKLDGSDNSDRLLDKFVVARDNNLNMLSNVQRKLAEIRETIDEFQPKLTFHGEKHSLHNVKQDLYRLPTLIINIFKTMNGVSGDTTWEVLDNLNSRGMLTDMACHNLKTVISIVTLLRLMTYIQMGRQSETITFLSASKVLWGDSDQNDYIHFKDYKNLLFRYYFTTEPLIKCFKESCHHSIIGKCKRECFYDRNSFTMGLIALTFLSFTSARRHFSDHLKTLSLSTKICDTREKAKCFLFLGHVERKLERFDDALKFYFQAYEIVMKDMVQPDILLAAWATKEIGDVYCDKMEFQEALKFSHKSHDLVTKIHRNANHLNVAASLTSLGIVHEGADETKLALKYHKQSLHMTRELYDNKSHQDVAQALNNVGNSFRYMGEHRQAMEYLKECLGMWREIHGHNCHDDVAATLNNLAKIYISLGDYDLAEKCQNESLEMLRDVHGDGDHPSVAFAFDNLAVIFRNLGKLHRAEHYHKRSLAMNRNIHSHHLHRDVAMAMINLGIFYHETDQLQQAMTHFKDGLAMMKAIHPNGYHTDIGFCLNRLGRVYCSMDEFNLAEQHFKECLALERKSRGDIIHKDIGNILHNIGIIYHKQHDYLHAVEYLQESLEMIRKIHLDGNHEEIAGSLDYLSTLYYEMKDWQSALCCVEECVQMRRILYNGENSPILASSINNLAGLYCKTGQYGFAERSLKETLSIRKNIYGDESHPEVVKAMRNLSAFYEAGGHLLPIHRAGHDGSDNPTENRFLNSLTTAQALYGARSHAHLAISFLNLSIVYTDKGNISHLLTHIKSSIFTTRLLHCSYIADQIATNMFNR